MLASLSVVVVLGTWSVAGLVDSPIPLDKCSTLANRCIRRDKACLVSTTQPQPTTALLFTGSASRFGVICHLPFGFCFFADSSTRLNQCPAAMQTNHIHYLCFCHGQWTTNNGPFSPSLAGQRSHLKNFRSFYGWPSVLSRGLYFFKRCFFV